MANSNTLKQTGVYPLSSSQSRIWFIENLDKSITAYNIPLDFRIHGDLKIEILREAIGLLVERHDAMRTIFPDVNGSPVQKVLSSIPVPLEIVSLKDENKEQIGQIVRKHSLDHGKHKFDITKGPLFHFRLLILDEQEYIFLLNFHHLISDATSVGIFLDELTALYESLVSGKPADLPPLIYQYPDYAVEQKEWLNSSACREQLDYWKNELSGIPEMLKLPLDHHRPKIQTYKGTEYHFTIEGDLREKLAAISQKHKTTLFIPLLTAFEVLLSRYSLQDDFVVGVPVANRNHFEWESLIGVLINSLPLRFTLSPDMIFADVLEFTKKKFYAAYENQEVPFEKLVEELKVKRNMSSPPIFQVLFNYLSVYRSEYQLPGLSMQMEPGERSTSQLDLTLTVNDHKTQLECNFEYNTDLFDEETVARLAGHYLTFLRQIPSKEDLPVGAITLLTTAEEKLMLEDWNKTEAPYPSDKCLHQQFEEQVAKTPDSIAVMDDKEELTYAGLNARANQLAHALAKKGAKEDTFIAVCLERGIDLPVAFLAIAKTGATYLPLDPIYPKARLGLILEDAKPVLFVTQRSLLDKLPETEAELILMDDKITYNHEPEDNLHYGNPGKAAYILYTSGSTGKPKGVRIRHDSTLNAVLSLTKRMGVTSRDIVLGLTTVAFDVAEMDLYLPLLNGAKLVMASQETVNDIELVKKKIDESGATVLLATPVTFKMLVLSSWKGKKDLKILSGGEGFPREIAAELLKRCEQVWNGYAPTETTIYSLVKRVTIEDTKGEGYVALGRPFENTKLYVLNSKFVPVPIGVPGELYIGGAGVSLGYQNLPEMTKERFIPDIFGNDPAARLYKTGDLVQYLDDGTVVFLNRIDFQVKIRGFRIELGEIESVLSQYPGIKENVVIVRNDASGEKMLAAYYVNNSSAEINYQELRRYLKERLPDYMVPAVFVALDSFPLTSTLKVDRKALPEPMMLEIPASEKFEGPGTDTERKLTQIWSSLLNHKKIGIHDDFFEIGGHSMIAVTLMVKIEKVMGIRLPLASLFERSTIRLLGELIDQKEELVEWRSLVPIRPEGSKKPLFLVHGLGLNVLLYTSIITHLDPDQPVYGLQAKGLNGIDDPLSTMEEIAAYYISEILTIDPEGPYGLAGFSLGGRIAYEMARQLTAMGKTVGFLGVLDTTADGTVSHLSFLARFTHKINYSLQYIAWNIGNFIKEPNSTKLTVLKRRWVGLQKKMQGLDHKIDKTDLVSKGKKNELPKYLRKVHRANRLANSNYRVLPYSGTVHLFKAQKQTFYIPDPVYYSWDKVALGGVIVHEIPGEHSSTFAPPNDKYFATVLQDSLNESYRKQ